MSNYQIFSLLNIKAYLGVLSEETERLLFEGERACHSKHIVACAKFNANEPVEKGLDVKALVLQSSDHFDIPHQVSISLKKGKVLQSFCTCEGLSMRCKHIVGTLIHLNRSSLEDLEDLSAIDIDKHWEYMNHLALDKNKQVGLPIPVVTNKIDLDQIRFVKSLMGPPPNLNLLGLESFLDEPFQKFYESVVITPEWSAHLCLSTAKQTIAEGWKERHFRIGTDNAYHIYDYTKNKTSLPDETLKYLFRRTFISVITEDVTKTAGWQLFLKNEYKITRLGLFVNPTIPWLIHFPVGIVDGQYLLEIEHPAGGDKANIKDVLTTLSYIKGNIEQKTLKMETNTNVFHKINIAMGIMNLKKCLYMLFCTFDGSHTILEIPFAANLFQEYVSVLEKTYFGHILPFIKDK